MELSENVFYVADDERIFFASMIPEEVMEEAELIIGCVLEDEKEEVYPGGVLAVSGFDEGFVKINFLYVPKKERRKGIGREMMRQLLILQMNPEMGIDTFQCSYINNENTRSLNSFLTAMGFEGDQGAEAYSFVLADVSKFPEKPANAPGITIRELGELPLKYFNQLSDEIYKRFLDEKESKGKYIPLEERSYYDPGYSFLYLDEDLNCQGGVLVSRQPWGFMLEYVCCLKSDGYRTVLALISELLKKGKANEPPYTMIRLSAVLKGGGDFLKKFCEKEPIREGMAVTRIYQT